MQQSPCNGLITNILWPHGFAGDETTTRISFDEDDEEKEKCGKENSVQPKIYNFVVFRSDSGERFVSFLVQFWVIFFALMG